MAERIAHPIFSAIDRYFDAERDMTEAKRNLAKAFISWLDNQAIETGAGAVEVETSREIALAPILSDKRELSVKELAARWGVSTRSIYEWKTTGGLKFKKVGRLLRFDTIEADLWARRHQESLAKRRLRLVR